MRQLPRKLVILSQDVPITRVHSLEHEGQDCYGMFDPDESCIHLTDGQGRERIRNTLLHESLHAMLEIGWLARSLEHDDEERIVANLAPVLLAFIRQNPAVVAYLQEKA